MEDGLLKGARGIPIDATDQSRAAEVLRESDEFFRSYLEYAPDGVYMSDLEGNFLYGNRKCEEITGYRREELIGKNFLALNILPGKSLNKAVQLLQANREEKSTGPDEIELINKEGRLIPVEINTSVVQLILPIGEFVIRTVCMQIKTWQEAGYKPTSIALNLSSSQFEKQNLTEIVKKSLQDTMISPQCLELEITESTIMRNPEKVIRTLTELKALGLRIAIDDFGTGYSSLSYLKRLPLDFLKIDQSFVKSLASDPSDQAIVRATIAMAHSLNLKTVAEGVETEEQLSFLQEHGCDEIQGYLFSRPLLAEEIPEILAKGCL